MVKTLGFDIITENIACSDFFKVLIFIRFYAHILLIGCCFLEFFKDSVLCK